VEERSVQLRTRTREVYRLALLASVDPSGRDPLILRVIGITEPTTDSVIGLHFSEATISIRPYLTRGSQVIHPPGTPSDPEGTILFGSPAFGAAPQMFGEDVFIKTS
jgi:hypothetical protein